ncbi:hypothetical protein M5D96_013819 [Drosophila gunungcola]|uniref:Uncharacterized protein n=1 Tax=Drosophila gunungcola TaxID=103775 RepID=A0A9P9YAJ6_9MUSC|nr:hypothetical protein M5D96_013819 [Drosophila gunungcola]
MGTWVRRYVGIHGKCVGIAQLECCRNAAAIEAKLSCCFPELEHWLWPPTLTHADEASSLQERKRWRLWGRKREGDSFRGARRMRSPSLRYIPDVHAEK